MLRPDPGRRRPRQGKAAWSPRRSPRPPTRPTTWCSNWPRPPPSPASRWAGRSWARRPAIARGRPGDAGGLARRPLRARPAGGQRRRRGGRGRAAGARRAAVRRRAPRPARRRPAPADLHRRPGAPRRAGWSRRTWSSCCRPPASRDPDYFAFRLFAEMLGGGMSSRLFQEARERLGLAYAIDAYAEAYAGRRRARRLRRLRGRATPAALAEVAAERDPAADRRASGAAELARAKAQLKAALFMARESPGRRAEQAAAPAAGLRPPADAPAEIAAAIDAVGRRRSAPAWARACWRPASCAGAVLGPAKRAGRRRRASQTRAVRLSAAGFTRPPWPSAEARQDRAHGPARLDGDRPRPAPRRRGRAAAAAPRRRLSPSGRRCARARAPSCSPGSRPGRPTTSPAAAFRRRLAAYAHDMERGLAYPFLVFRQSDNAMVGGITLSNIRRGVAQMGSIGYWVGEPLRPARLHPGRGAGGDAVLASSGWACTGSRRPASPPTSLPGVLLKAGFTQEGLARVLPEDQRLWRDHLLFGLSRRRCAGRDVVSEDGSVWGARF